MLFGKFCHLELGGDVPMVSTLDQFRNQLAERGLWEQLLGEINHQLDAEKIILTKGHVDLICTIPVEAAQSGLG